MAKSHCKRTHRVRDIVVTVFGNIITVTSVYLDVFSHIYIKWKDTWEQSPYPSHHFIPRNEHKIWQVLVHNICLLNRYLEVKKQKHAKKWFFDCEDIGMENSPPIRYRFLDLQFSDKDRFSRTRSGPTRQYTREERKSPCQKRVLKRKTWTRNVGWGWEEKTIHNSSSDLPPLVYVEGRGKGTMGRSQEERSGTRKQERKTDVFSLKT